jgi:hypothetical protein
MRRSIVLLTGIVLCAMCSIAFAAWGVVDKGAWPESWPKELEPLRNQAQTYVGSSGQRNYVNYLIPFTERDQFEAAWPHLLKVTSKGAPIVLVRGPKTDFLGIKPAGVIIHTPPDGPKQPEEPRADNWARDEADRWWTDCIELVVDGDIVDLNRIPLPADRPIIDERSPAATAALPDSGGPANALPSETAPANPGADRVNADHATVPAADGWYWPLVYAWTIIGILFAALVGVSYFWYRARANARRGGALSPRNPSPPSHA